MSNYRSPSVKARDEELMALYPHVATYELAERFGMSEDAIRSRAKYLNVKKLTGCRRKPMTKADRTKPREPVAVIEPVSQEPDAAGRALLGKWIDMCRWAEGYETPSEIDPCSMAAEIVGIISGVEQAERERARQERIEAERTPCASKKKEAILEAIGRIMAYVKWNPECRTMSVARAVGCCKSVAFDRLCRLEDDGLVTRYKTNNISYWSVL